MAHVGKFWELALRRDLLYGATSYRKAFPSRFLIGFEVDVLDPTLKQYEFSNVPLSEEDPPASVASWTGPDVTSLGKTVTPRLAVRGLDNPGQTPTVYIEAWSGGTQVLGIEMKKLDPASNGNWIQKDPAMSPTVYDPAFWGGTFFGAGGSGAIPVTW